MYSIESTGYGLKLTFTGHLDKHDVLKWRAESDIALAATPGLFCVLVDMRELKPLPRDAQQELVDGQYAFRQQGMERSAVILDSAVVTMQFKRLAKASGIWEWERYFDASEDAGWEERALAWLQNGTDPDA